MDEILKLLIAYFASRGVAPPEIRREDEDREKSYLIDLPEEPDNVFVFRESSSRHSKIHPSYKSAVVKRCQCLVRDRNQADAFTKIEILYKFLTRTHEVDGTPREMIEELNSQHWMILDCHRGPQKISIDEKGRHIWSLSFVITTNLF